MTRMFLTDSSDVRRAKGLLLIAIVCCCFVILSPSTCEAKYELSDWNAVHNGIYYKWMPSNWWAAYYLQEFDKVAPTPGANWMTEKTSAISPWLDSAREKGWVVKTRASEAKVGAIAICQNPEKGFARLYIVREVHDWGFKGSYIDKNGEPKEGDISYSFLLSSEKGYSFRGYIWPEKMPK